VVPDAAVHGRARILEKDSQVVVEEIVSSRHRLHAPEPQSRARDDAERSQARDRGPEQLFVVLRRARFDRPGPGDDVDLDDVVPLRAVPERRDADSGHRQGATDGNPQIVRQDGRDETPRGEVVNQIAPDDAGFDVHRQIRFVHGTDAAHRLHVDEHAVAADGELRLRVRGAACGQAQRVAPAERDQRDDVVLRFRAHDVTRSPAKDAAVVLLVLDRDLLAGENRSFDR
jgi:hypothetical protein